MPQPAQVASSIQTETRSDGSVAVRIDSDPSFFLPPTPAALLEVLKMDSGASDDELVAWKTLEDISLMLTNILGRKVTPHSVTNSIHRLRQILAKSRPDGDWLVQTRRGRGARFALRREKALRPEMSNWSDST